MPSQINKGEESLDVLSTLLKQNFMISFRMMWSGDVVEVDAKEAMLLIILARRKPRVMLLLFHSWVKYVRHKML